MRKLLILIVIMLSITTTAYTQKTPFNEFDKDVIDVGTLYVYEYSRNKEYFEPGNKRYLYIKTLNDIEILMVSIEDTIATWMDRYKMNWNYMMFEDRKWINLRNKNDMGIGAGLKGGGRIDFSKKLYRASGIQKYKEGFKEWNFIHKLESFPSYLYKSTSLIPLWFALRFYPLDKNQITVNSNTNDYNLKFKIKYAGKEKVKVKYGNVLCHKFELIPKLSFWMKLFRKSKKAFIWLTSEDTTRYMVKYRNSNEQNTFTQSMEYRLEKRRKMTLAEWNEFKEKSGVNLREISYDF